MSYQEYYYDYEEKVEEKKEEILEEEEEFYHDNEEQDENNEEQEAEDENDEDVEDSQDSPVQKKVKDEVDSMENEQAEIVDSGKYGVEVIDFKGIQDKLNEENVNVDHDNVKHNNEEGDGEVEPTIEDLLNEHLQEPITTTTVAPTVEVVEIDLEHDLESESLIPTRSSQGQKANQTITEIPRPVQEVQIPRSNHSNSQGNHNSHLSYNANNGNHSHNHSKDKENHPMQDSNASKDLDEPSPPEDIGIPHLSVPIEAKDIANLEEDSEDDDVEAHSANGNNHEVGLPADGLLQAKPTAVDEMTKTILGGKVSITVKHLGTKIIRDPPKEDEVS